MDRAGRPTVLRGFDVAVGSPSVYHEAAALGANFVRIYVGWSQIEPTRPTGPHGSVHHWNEPLLGELDREVSDLRSDGVNVLIDFHQFHWSPYYAQAECKPDTACKASGIPAWFYEGRYPDTKSGEARAKTSFWTTESRESLYYYAAFAAMMARRYGHYPNVVGYEIFNEPHTGDLPDATSTTNTVLRWEGQIARVLHAVDPTRAAVVMCRGGGEGIGTADLGVVGDLAHVALDFHDYYNGLPGTGLDAQGDNWTPSWQATHNQDTPGPYQGSEQAQAAVLAVPVRVAQRYNVPLLVGEWGIHNGTPDSNVYQQQMLGLFARDHVSWARWTLGTGGGFALLDGYGTPTPDASQLRQALQS